jgi:predicted O-methyltransferase YrrM
MVLGRRFSLDSGRPKDVSGEDVTGQRDTAGSRTPRPRLVLERLLGERTAVARSNGTVQSLFPVAVGAAEGEALRAWVQGENATRTIEIGLGYGIAALFVCEGLLANGDPAARHVAVDPNQATRFANCGLQFLDEAGVAELVEFHPEESELALPRFLAEARSFDLAFVDGNHRFDGVFLDLIYLGRLVRAGGILFVDDYQLPSVARAVAFCTTNLGWTLEEVSTDDDLHHWTALRTAPVPRERPFQHYVDF